MEDRPFVARVARAICQETCAFMGEPPCWRAEPQVEPKDNENCREPGCHALAIAAVATMNGIREQ